MENIRSSMSKKAGPWALILMGSVMITLIIAGEIKAKNPIPREAAPALDIPEPQYFCGTCHVLTYPGIIQKQYELWKQSKHNDVGCVVCHYGLGDPEPTQKLAASHLPPQPPHNFTHLKIGGETVQTRSKIDDATCMTAICHGKPEDEFKTKRIQFTEKVTFVHQPHLEDKNQVKGQRIGCTNCHQHETDTKKFEVSRDSCYLCHFMSSKLNEGKSRCELCHQLPEEPIEPPAQEAADAWGDDAGDGGGGNAKDDWGIDSEDDAAADTGGEVDLTAASSQNDSSQAAPDETKPITHAMLKDAGVACTSCHFELVQAGTGATYSAYFEKGVLKTAVVYGVGKIKKENCISCHDKEKDLTQALAMELLHKRHVTDKTARCLDCHEPVKHTKAKLEERMPQDEDPVLLTGCMTCHPLPHFNQRILTSGFKSMASDPVPDPMYAVGVNCLGCHKEQITLPNGQVVLKASDKTCLACHDKTYKNKFKQWKKELKDRMTDVSRIEQNLLKMLKKSKTNLSDEQLKDMMHQIEKAREDFAIVKFGNGVHNREFALQLLNNASKKLTELERSLDEGQK